MICLLCYDSNGEFTTIDSDQGKESNISSLLQKHFGFLFVVRVFFSNINKTKTITSNIIFPE